MAKLWDKFDSAIDVEGLKKDVKEAAENGGDFKEVPIGEYEVKITKLELGETKTGNPAMKVWFKILVGEYKGSMLFMTQVLSSGFGIHKANEFLRSLGTEHDIEFNSYNQYGELLMDIAEYIDDHKLEYGIEYGQKGDFKTFDVKDIFETE